MGTAALGLGWIMVASVVVGVALFRRNAFRPVAALAAGVPRSALLVRPCRGLEPGLERCLLSVARARYGFPLQVRMGVAEQSDAAAPVAQRVAASLRDKGIDAQVVVVPPRGSNHKASIVAGVCTSTEADVIINADSNVDLAGLDLDALVEPLVRGEGVGAVWAPHVEVTQERTLGARASTAVLGGSLHAFALLCGIDPRGLVGKLFAFRRDAAEATAALPALVHYLGEDMELSRRLRQGGWTVRPVLLPVRSVGSVRTLRHAIDRQARWTRVIRAQRPWLLLSYPLLFAPTPFLLLLGAAAAYGSPAWGGVLLTTAALWRVTVAAAARTSSALPITWVDLIIDAVLADGVILAALVLALTHRSFTWRGRKLRITRGGHLVEALSPASGSDTP